MHPSSQHDHAPRFSPSAVVLRVATAQDLPWLRALAASEHVKPYVAAVTEDVLDDAVAGGEVRVVEDRGGAVLGAVRLVLVNRRSRIGEVRMLMLDPAARGRGLAVATLRALAAEAFGALGLHRLQGEVLAYNSAGLRAFDAAGFRREGIRRRAYWRRGDWQDGVHVGLLADE